MSLESVSPSTKNYMRGGTRVFVKRDGETNFVHLGNIVNVSVARDEDIQEHVTGIDGSRVIDRKRQEVKAINYTVQCDESTKENVRMWLLGGSSSTTSQSATVGNATKISELINTTYSSIVAGRYYSMLIDKAATTSFKKMWDKSQAIAITGLTAGTDFFVDYVAGKIAFKATPGSDATVTGAGKLTAYSGGYKFDQFDNFRLDVSAEGVHSFEDGDIRDFWTIPKAQLIPSGDGSISIENDRTLEFTLSQLKDTLLGWGTYERVDVGS